MVRIYCSKHAFDQNVGHTNKSTFNNDECCICVRDEGSDEKVVFQSLYVRKYSVEWAHLPVLNAIFSKVKQNNINPCSMEIVFEVLPTIQGLCLSKWTRHNRNISLV